MGQQGDFVVYSIDDVVHACGSLHDFGDGQAEIAAIATIPFTFTEHGTQDPVLPCR
jgi:amino-acid N-acetyltransferase